MTLLKFTIVFVAVFCVHCVRFSLADSDEYVDFRGRSHSGREYGPSSSLSPTHTSFSSSSSSKANGYDSSGRGVYDDDDRRSRHHPLLPFSPSFILRTPTEPTSKPKLQSHFEPYEAYDFNFNNRGRSRRPHHFNKQKHRRPSYSSKYRGHKKTSAPKKQYFASQAEASYDDPIIFSFKVHRRTWSRNYKRRLASLQQKRSSLDDMENYAKPSTMQLGYKLWNWVKGFGSKKDPGSSPSTTSEKLEEPDKESKHEGPTYYTRTYSSTEVVQGAKDPSRFKNMIIPPVAFMPVKERGSNENHHHHRDEDYNRYPNSKESDLPLTLGMHDDDLSSSKGKRHGNPQCSKGGSLIFCNSDALTGLLELLEAHMGKSKQHDDDYYSYNNEDPSHLETHYDEKGESPIIEVIEMDPQEENGDLSHAHYSDDPQTYTYTKSGAVDFGYHDYNKDTPGYKDDDGLIEIVIVVHTKKGSYGIDNSSYNKYRSGYGDHGGNVGHGGDGGHEGYGGLGEYGGHGGLGGHEELGGYQGLGGHGGHGGLGGHEELGGYQGLGGHGGHGEHGEHGGHEELGGYPGLGGHEGLGGYGGHGGSSGSYTKNPHINKHKKPYRNLDDDDGQNEYDKKFDRLKKIVDIIRYKHNKDERFTGDDYYYNEKNQKMFKGKLKYSRGNGEEDGYWNSLLEEFKLRHGYDFVPHDSRHSSMSNRKGPSVSMENVGLVIDMRKHGKMPDRHMMGRIGKMQEKYFGLAKAGKSKHASADERAMAIRTKVAQVAVAQNPTRQLA